jgi:endo-1,4-beta-xylanase
MAEISRRSALGLVAGAGVLAACATGSQPVFPVEQEPLKDLAQQKGLLFGTAMAAYQIDDPEYVKLVQRECGVIVSENEHKWYTIHPQPDEWNFAPADALVGFAKANDLKMRGHTVVWHHPRWFPEWVNNTTFASAAEAEAVLGDYITRVTSRAHPFIHEWDVINEAVDDKTGELRETSFSRAMGGPLNVIEFCFNKTAEISPGTRLAYNDYMSWETGNENHRNGVLKLMEALLKRGAPLSVFGIQSHSNFDMPDEFTPAKQKAWRAFCDEAVGMGLDLSLTEFDVNDTDLGPSIPRRDALIASFTKDYLDIMFSYPQTKELLMWGLVDKYSWLQGFMPRTDDVEKRPTLYDSSYRPKAMREAVAAALRAAPARS